MSEMLEFMFKLDVAMNNGFSQPARAMTGEMQKLMQAGQKLQSQFGKTQELDELRKKIQASESGLEQLRAGQRQNAQSLEESRKRTATLGNEYETAKKRVADWSKILPKNSTQLMQAKRRAEELKQAYQESAKDVTRFEREQENLSKKAGAAEQALSREREKLTQLESELQKAGINTQNLSGEQDRLTRTMEKLSRAQTRMQNIRETLSWGNIKKTFMEAAAVYMPLKPMVQISGDFEEAMQKVKAVGFSSEGADLTKFNEMKAQALKLGAETSFTAIQSANAQENLIRAGFTPDETMKAMPGLLNMAAAEGLDLAQAASIVAGSIKSIGLEAEDAGKIADMFAFASAYSATNIANIGEAFAGTAGTARGLKVEADQLTAMLMSLANQQVEASIAGTAMSSTFMRLAKEPKATAEALAKYHVAIMTRAGDMRELPDILAELYKNTEKFGSKNQIQAFANVFGVSFGDSMYKLAQASLPGKNGALSEYEQNLKNIREKAPGQAQRMTDIKLDSLNGQLTILGSAIDGVKIALGDMFNPIVRKGVEWLTNALSKLNEILVEFPEQSKWVVYALTAFASTKAIPGILRIGGAILSLPGAWLEYMNAAKTAAAVTGTQAASMSGVLSLIRHPIAALKSGFMALWGVIAAHPFVALIAAMSAIYYYWDDIKAAGQKFVDWWNSIEFADIWQSVKESFNEMLNWLYEKWQGFKDFFSNLNPMNWFGGSNPPSAEQLALQEKATRTSAQGQNASAIADRFSRAYTPHAFGGIMTSPHLGLVAEAGPEAIVPLRDKSRGIEVLSQAANILGLNVSRESGNETGISSIAGGVINHVWNDNRINNDSNSRSNNNLASNSSFTININVDGRNESDSGLAMNIAERVREAMQSLLQDQVRLNYA